ncbi:PIR Superfamily Protein [Plasmodium ovale wallikeri]|uniref:PIR Superfamily Protein n=1 Tax=Plasmodium ovale wallikeri TaxID=864142 RepID=A0A1A9AMC7_PLAOA|nr:PIR Superfamily Protein [Plasmodium ovale wallikeri]
MTPLTEEEYYNMAGDYLPYKGMLDTYANSSYSFYETYCDDVISKKLNKNSGYMKPCLALLKYSYTVKDEGSIFHITIPCNYLNIWLKDQIKIIPGYIFDVLEFYNILNSHNLCKSVVNGLCNGKISNIDDGFFNNFQILLTLYDNLNKYRNNLFDNDLSKCEYLDICADSYEEQVKVCNSNNPSPFCNELKKFKEQYNRDMKSEHDCKELKKKILLFPGEVHTEGQLERRDEASPAPRMEELRGEGASEPNSIHYSIIIPVSIILLVPFLFLIFYKFTPLGSFLSPWIREKKKQWYNNYEHDDHLLHDTENEEIDLQNTRYNI